MKYTINEKFLWGGSVSAHQTEGGNDVRYGKGPSIYDVKKIKENHSDWTVAIDSYHRYKEDIKLFKEMGMNAYRFSISWSRILPEGEGKINDIGVQFYHDFIDELIKNDIEPIICTYHFDIPLKLQVKYGGWKSKHVIEAYDQFVSILANEYASKVKTWIPFNEHNGAHIPSLIAEKINVNDTDFLKVTNQIAYNITVADAICRKRVKAVNANAKIGAMIQYCSFYPETSHPLDSLAADIHTENYSYDMVDPVIKGRYTQKTLNEWEQYDAMPLMTDTELEMIKRYKADFVAFSYYFSQMTNRNLLNENFSKLMYSSFIGSDDPFPKNKFLEKTEWDWQIDHVGLRLAMKRLDARYNLPIYILESGLGIEESLNDNNTVDDDYRINYFENQFKEMKKAMEFDGVDCRGHLTWAPIDILSSRGEMKKRYGFIYVDRGENDLKSLNRYKKKSFSWFKKVIESKGEFI